MLLSMRSCLHLEGDVVEVGCFKGCTSRLLQMALERFGSEKQLHVYDSFEGLPEKTKEDGTPLYEKGLLISSIDVFRNNLKGCRMPKIHKGWFEDTLPTGLPERICFGFLDGDYYSSIKVSLEHVWPRLSPGGILFVHDYPHPKFVGVAKAVDEFARVNHDVFMRVYRNSVILAKVTQFVCGQEIDV